MNTQRKLPTLVLLAVGTILGSSAAVAQNVARDIPKDPPEIEIPDDLALAKTVQDNLLRAPRSSALDIKVRADDGVVTLSGEVASEEQRTRAETIARTSDGVADVKNRIIVRARAGDDLQRHPRGTSWDPPRTSPTPVTPGAPSLPNGAPTLPPPLPELDPE